jgi:hypothetical protein
MLLLALAVGCTDVHGGAVELSWTLRPESGDSVDLFVNCDTGVAGANPVDRMRLDWVVGSNTGSDSWACTDYHGVTGFEVPAGSALLTITPVCGSGDAPPITYTAPTPQERDVSVGNTVDLGAIEVFVEITQCFTGSGSDGGSGSGQQCICGSAYTAPG